MLEEDTQALRSLAKKSKDYREVQRLRALYALSTGYSIQQVAIVFDVDDSTIYDWIEWWKNGRRMADEPRSGRKPKLDENDRQTIRELLEENNPSAHGLNASYWDTKELQTYFHQQGIDLSRDALRVALKNMGGRYVKATLEYAETSYEKQLEFALQFFEDLFNKPPNVEIVFEDEMSAECTPRKGYGWTLGKRLFIKAPQKNRERLNCFGAVNPLTGQITEHSSKNAKSPEFIKMLEKIAEEYAEKVVRVYMDRGPVHRAKIVTKFFEDHPNIERRYLPPYSPKLNPQENYHGFKRQKLLNNKYFKNVKSLAVAMRWFGKRLSSEVVRKVCNLSAIQGVIDQFPSHVLPT